MKNLTSFGEHQLSRGFALIEVLISFLIMAVGLMTLLSFHSTSQRNISEAKTQAEAVVLAEEKLQELESFLSGSDSRLSDGVYSESDIDGLLSSFDMTWTIDTDASDSTQKNALVTVSWQDRDDVTQQVVLSSDIYFRDPAAEAQDFMLALQEVRESTSGDDYVWDNSGGEITTGSDEENTDDNTTDDTVEDQDDTTDNSTVDPVYRSITISGSVDVSGSGTRFTGVTVSNSNYSVSCVHTDTAYDCTSESFPESESLTVKFTYGTNKVVCVPSAGYFQFNNIDQNITSGYDVKIRKNASDC